MAAHPDLPKPKPLLLDKAQIFARLKAVDQDPAATRRILRMERDFRARIGSHLTRLPARTAKFQKFNTNPFVLMFYSKQQSISDLHSILDTSGLPAGYNVAILQKSQLEWILFLARHLADGLT